MLLHDSLPHMGWEGRTPGTKALTQSCCERCNEKLCLHSLTAHCGARPGATCSTGSIKLNIEWQLAAPALLVLHTSGGGGHRGEKKRKKSKAKIKPHSRLWMYTAGGPILCAEHLILQLAQQPLFFIFPRALFV